MRSLALTFLLLAPAAAQAKSSFTVSYQTDPRIELVSVVLRLARGTRGGSAYADAADARFAANTEHPAVARARRMIAGDSRGNLPAKLVLHLGPPPALQQRQPFPPELVSYAGGAMEVSGFVDELRDFAKRAAFQEFLAKHRGELRDMEKFAHSEAGLALDPASVALFLEVDRETSYSFLLTPLLPPELETDFSLTLDGRKRRYWLRSGFFRDGRQSFNLGSFGNSAAHELAHVILNPLAQDPGLPGTPPKGCNDNGGASWTLCLQEHLVYAVTLRLLAEKQGEGIARPVIKEYAGKGFPYLGALYAELKRYEPRRDKSFREFYPRLEAVFRRAAGSRP